MEPSDSVTSPIWTPPTTIFIRRSKSIQVTVHRKNSSGNPISTVAKSKTVRNIRPSRATPRSLKPVSRRRNWPKALRGSNAEATIASERLWMVNSPAM